MAGDQSTRGAPEDEGEIRGRAPIDLEVGEVIAGKYRVERLLGRGGMGTVWLCTHLGLGERIAVKVMSRQMANNAEVRTRFEREARASAKIKSRYVARVYDTGELPDERPYLVMEFMEGETLGHALQVSKTMSLADTARILGQVGRGLARAHELGIVHRDIKPDNVFLAHTSDDGVIAKVFDFGIVKVFDAISAADDTTQEGALLGTPQYMSPEQVEGLAIDLRSDVYALGVMAFRMLTGKRLFPGESLSATLMRICNGPLPRLAEALPEVPAAVDAWFERTCARDREARFPSAIECVDALASAAGVATALDVSVPPAASPTVPDGVPALPSLPLEPLTGMSAVHPTTPPLRSAPPLPVAGDGAESGRGRTRIAIVAAVAVAALVAFLFLSSGSPPHPVAELPAAASIAPAAPAPPPVPSLAPPPEIVPAPSASVAVDTIASAQPDAATRPSARPSVPRRRDTPRGTAPAKGDPPSSPDERIHDVGY